MTKTAKAEADRLVRTTVRLPRSLLSAAKHRAIDRGMTLQEVIIDALRSYLAKGGRP
jgi:predicted DNA binding CopG/RHH family protein